MSGGCLNWNFDTHLTETFLVVLFVKSPKVRRADHSYYTPVCRERQYSQNIYIFFILIYLYPEKEKSNIYKWREVILREKFYRFMQGRYGDDPLNRFLMIAALIAMILSIIWKPQFCLIALALLGWGYYRMFSRKVYTRAMENQRYLEVRVKALGRLNKERRLLAQRKDYHIYKCPGCGQKVRVPRGKGKIEVHCPKCGKYFVKKS